MITPLIDNENYFATLRRRLLNKPTIAEYQIGSRIATKNDQLHNGTVCNPLAQTRADKESILGTGRVFFDRTGRLELLT